MKRILPIFMICFLAAHCSEKPTLKLADTAKVKRPATKAVPTYSDEVPQGAALVEVNDGDMLDLIRDDLAKQVVNDQRKFRYFSLVKLANQGLDESLLEQQRAAFQKSLNRISLKGDVNPVAIDERRLFYRINVDELGITAVGFDKIVGDHYPFNYRFREIGTAESARRADLDATIRKRLLSNFLCIRMDWWNATALLPLVFANFKMFPEVVVDVKKEFPEGESLEAFLEEIQSDETILNGFRYYNRALTRDSAKIELGLAESDFGLVLRDPEFASTLNAWNNIGGKVSRGIFQTLFPKIVSKFRHDALIQLPLIGDFLETASCRPDGDNGCDITAQREYFLTSR